MATGVRDGWQHPLVGLDQMLEECSSFLDILLTALDSKALQWTQEQLLEAFVWALRLEKV